MGSAASAQSDHLLAGELEKPLDARDLSNESAKAEVSVVGVGVVGVGAEVSVVQCKNSSWVLRTWSVPIAENTELRDHIYREHTVLVQSGSSIWSFDS
jgi:hypothetical protein